MPELDLVTDLLAIVKRLQGERRADAVVLLDAAGELLARVRNDVAEATPPLLAIEDKRPRGKKRGPKKGGGRKKRKYTRRAKPAAAQPTPAAPAPAGAKIKGLALGIAGVTFGGKTVGLTERENIVCAALLKVSPSIVGRQDLIARIWNGSAPSTAEIGLTQVAGTLRDKLAPLGLLVRTVKNFGYTLQEA